MLKSTSQTDTFIKWAGNFIFTGYKCLKLKRRDVLRRLGFGMTSVIAGGGYLMSCKKDDPLPEIQYDGIVAVIGAGASGLAAADILSAKGVNVIVLEASNQLGGRIRSLKNQQGLQSIADFPVELGAEYFQGVDSVLGKIIDNMNLQTIDLSTARDLFIMDSVAKDSAGWAGDADFTASQQFVEGIRDYRGSSASVREAAGNVATRAQELINAQAGNFYGSTSDRVGITGLSDQMRLITHTEEYRMLKHNSMQDMIISRFSDVVPKVQLDSPVKSINYGGEMVTITLENGTTVEANKVIVTVPVSILKDGITFSPALPQTKVNALSRIGMDPAMRVILDFKKNFWGEDTGFIWGGTVAPVLFNAGVSRSQFNRTMSITICGERAQALSDLPTEEAVINAILTELDGIYDGQATDFLRTGLPPDDEDKKIYFIQDWTKEKYFKGGYTFPMVNTSIDDRTALSEPLDGKLFFAGDATDIGGDAGTLNGALASAERVVEEVAKSIRGTL